MVKYKLNKELFLAMIEQEESEWWIPVATLGVIIINVN
jgi:hypothetical protein